MNEISVPVLIVGAGPAGLATSLLLSRYGVAHMLVEKYPGTAHTPRAHIVNQRTVEIFRHMGIEDRLLAVGTPQHLMSNNVWSTSLAGLEVARLQTWGTSPDRAADYRKASPSPMTNCPQTVLEPLLVAAIIEAGVCDLRFNHEFLELRQDDSGVTATIRDRSAGQDLTVRSQYLVGADGGRSRVLDQAGLTVEGDAGLAEAANIWFAADLTRYLSYRPGVLYWNVSPGTDFMVGAGTLICHKPWSEFVMVIMYDPNRETISDREDYLVGRVHKVIGDSSVEVTLKGFALWQINCRASTPADQRVGAQHLDRRCLQPRLETRPGPRRTSRTVAAGDLLRRATTGRTASGRPGHHQRRGNGGNPFCPWVCPRPIRE